MNQKKSNDHFDYSVINTCKSKGTYKEYMKKKKPVFRLYFSFALFTLYMSILYINSPPDRLF